MNNYSFEADSSTWKDKQIEKQNKDFLSLEANTCQPHNTTATQTQSNNPHQPSSRVNHYHNGQQGATDDRHFDKHLLYTMIASLNVAFTQSITDIQRHYQTQLYTPTTMNLPSSSYSKRHPTSRRKKNNYQTYRCYRRRQRGHLSRNCKVPLIRKQDPSPQSIGDKSPKDIKTEPHPPQTVFPTLTRKTTIQKEYQEHTK